MMPLYKRNSLVSLIEELRILFGKTRLTKVELQILEQQFSYFARLSGKHKKEFRDKLEVILTTKSFIGRGGLKIVTSEMKILIGATIVMVTFGWKDLRLPHFSKILIYPNSYYSSISKKYHNGEVNPRYGIIVVSWATFQAGMDDLHDGRNLGIHEVAHALHLENLIRNNQESNFFNPKVWANFQHLAQMEMQHKNGEALPWLGERASVDLHEFFAVALEHFFEKPHEFFRQAPELYGVLVRLLRQDPRVWMPKSEVH